MTWYYSYDEGSDETTIWWENGDDSSETVIGGQITQWRDGYPNTHSSREAVAELIQSAGTPERIRMQFDLNYGFEHRLDDND